jgi:hypothetical protein
MQSEAPGYVRLTLSEWDRQLAVAERELRLMSSEPKTVHGDMVEEALTAMLTMLQLLRQGQVRGTFVRD